MRTTSTVSPVIFTVLSSTLYVSPAIAIKETELATYASVSPCPRYNRTFAFFCVVEHGTSNFRVYPLSVLTFDFNGWVNPATSTETYAPSSNLSISVSLSGNSKPPVALIETFTVHTFSGNCSAFCSMRVSTFAMIVFWFSSVPG